MKVLISGCARSGTTLLVNLMQYFDDSLCIMDDEKMPSLYYNHDEGSTLFVIKKPAHPYTSKQHFNLRKVLDHYKVIWLIRDGRDVITSKNHLNEYHVPLERWIYTNYQYQKHSSNKNMLLIRYEDLIKTPEAVMDNIGKFLNKKYSTDFVNFYTIMDANSQMNVGIVPRPIDSNNFGKWRDKKHNQVFIDLANNKLKNMFCNLLIQLKYDSTMNWIKKY